MIYEQFIVSIVELTMLSWQPILLYNFHNMRVTWLFYYFFKLQVHFLHSLENISIFNIWKLWLVRCDVIFSGTSLLLPKTYENFWSKEIPLWWFPDSTLKLNNSRTAWPIAAIYISLSSILNALSYEINLFSRCSSPLRVNFPWAYKKVVTEHFRCGLKWERIVPDSLKHVKKSMTGWHDFQMLSFDSVAEAHGLIYPRPLGENFSFASYTLHLIVEFE